jgi:GT2 family glycosyltransferase
MKYKHILPKNSFQKAEYVALLNAVKKYEERIREIESSSYWKIFLFLSKTKLVLTSESYLKSNNWIFFQRIKFLISKPGFLLISKFLRQLFLLLFGKVNFIIGLNKGFEKVNYKLYKEKNFPRESDLESKFLNISNLKLNPHIQIFVIVNSENFVFLNSFLNSIEKQVYDHFFVHFIYLENDKKILYILKNIVKNDVRYSLHQNDLKLELICEYGLFTKVNCILRDDCLYEFVNEINNNHTAGIIYSDNDFYSILNPLETQNPYFKPDWSPQTILSRNYIGDFFVVSKLLFDTIHIDNLSNLYGIILNYSYNTESVIHISKILYHQHEEEITIENIHDNHVELNNFLSKIEPNSYARVSEASLGCFEPVFNIRNPLVSIIIPSKNKSYILNTCIQSIMQFSTYKNFEIIIIDNGSTEKSFFSTVAQLEYNYPNLIKSYRENIPFNYSVLNNKAVKYAKGEYLLFLNNDTKLISENLIEELIRIAQLKNVGAVGPKLLYPNDTIQHAGIILSLDETGAHIYSGAHKDTSGYFSNTNCLTNYSAITGACMMINKDKFMQVGGFDENLAVDCNDIDLCCKLLSQGLYNVYVPWVKMYHHECLTRGNPILSKTSISNQLIEKQYFQSKWKKLIKNDPFYNKNLTRVSKKYEIKQF